MGLALNKSYRGMDDLPLEGKTVLVRVDINSPMDEQNEILDDKRFRMHLPTLKELENSKTVLLAHQSRAGKSDFTTMEAHAARLSELLGREVRYIEDIFGREARSGIAEMADGDVMLLENVRFFSEETLKRSAKEHAGSHPVRKLAPLADVFINDAFSVAHRPHLSVIGFTAVLPSLAGRLMEREIEALDKVLLDIERPSVFVLGGVKAPDSIDVAKNVLESGAADSVIFTGAVANIFLVASGIDIGSANKSFIEELGYSDEIDRAKKILSEFGDKIILPDDLALLNESGERIECPANKVADNLPIFDIGQNSIERFSKLIRSSGTVVMNGPAGKFEEEGFAAGTESLVRAATLSKFSVIGGGHISAVVEELGLADRVSHISSGGGACLRYLAGEKLPGIEALMK
ncbi:MAG: phosphoglycerate kinase [Candidatus Syntropharchaeales archaeon]